MARGRVRPGSEVGSMRSRSLPSIVAVLVLPAVLARGGEADKPDAIPCGSSEGIEAGPRLASWMEQRKAKCAHLTPYKPNLLERQILAFEKAERPSIAEVNFLGVYPRVQTIDHRSQLAGGFRFWRPDLEGSRFDLAADAFWSLQGFRYYGAQAGVVPHQGKDFPLFPFKGDEVFELANVRQGDDTPYMLYGSFSHRWAPRFDFFGIGPGSRAAGRARTRSCRRSKRSSTRPRSPGFRASRASSGSEGRPSSTRATWPGTRTGAGCSRPSGSATPSATAAPAPSAATRWTAVPT